MEKGEVKPVNREISTHWTLWRQDIYGNQYRMPLSFDDETAVDGARDQYTAKGHHQTYFTKQMEVEDKTDFIPMSTD